MAYGNLNVDTITTSTTGGVLGAGNASIMKNRIINGAMVIDQRNAGASVTPTTDGTYTLDRWVSGNSQASKFSVQQNAGAVTPPVGFTKYLGVTSLSAYSLAAGDYFGIQQKVEGFNIADLGWGTANAKTVTLSFQVYSSLTGTFGGCIYGGQYYPFTYTVSSANTWTTVSVTIAGSTSGTWNNNSSAGISVNFSLGTGTTYSGTAGAWGNSFLLSATGATSVVGTSGATFYITGVQLEVGSSATGFEYRQYGQELQLCQRYLPAYSGYGQVPGCGNFYTITSGLISINFPVQTRTPPTGIYATNAALYNIGTAGISTDQALSSFTFNQATTLGALFVGTAGTTASTVGAVATIRGNSGSSLLYFTGCEL